LPSARAGSDESAGLCHNFGSPDTDPIPADFFGSGSDAFTSTVCLRGVPLGHPQYGDADTLISRNADPFDRCDLPSETPTTVTIEIAALGDEDALQRRHVHVPAFCPTPFHLYQGE
jgi:hypothetical protein